MADLVAKGAKVWEKIATFNTLTPLHNKRIFAQPMSQFAEGRHHLVFITSVHLGSVNRNTPQYVYFYRSQDDTLRWCSDV